MYEAGCSGVHRGQLHFIQKDLMLFVGQLIGEAWMAEAYDWDTFEHWVSLYDPPTVTEA